MQLIDITNTSSKERTLILASEILSVSSLISQSVFINIIYRDEDGHVHPKIFDARANTFTIR